MVKLRLAQSRRAVLSRATSPPAAALQIPRCPSHSASGLRTAKVTRPARPAIPTSLWAPGMVGAESHHAKTTRPTTTVARVHPCRMLLPTAIGRGLKSNSRLQTTVLMLAHLARSVLPRSRSTPSSPMARSRRKFPAVTWVKKLTVALVQIKLQTSDRTHQLHKLESIKTRQPPTSTPTFRNSLRIPCAPTAGRTRTAPVLTWSNAET